MLDNFSLIEKIIFVPLVFIIICMLIIFTVSAFMVHIGYGIFMLFIDFGLSYFFIIKPAREKNEKEQKVDDSYPINDSDDYGKPRMY